MPLSEAAGLDQDTLKAVGQLLSEGQRVGVGLWFQPTQEQWSVSFMQGNGGGTLGEGPSLLAAATASFEQLRRGWPYARDDIRSRAVIVLLPDRPEAIAWDFESEDFVRCVARNVNRKRCANGIFEGQPGRPLKLFGGPGGYGYLIDGGRGDDYGRRADLQRCGLHVDGHNPDAVAHEGQRFRVASHDYTSATLR